MPVRGSDDDDEKSQLTRGSRGRSQAGLVCPSEVQPLNEQNPALNRAGPEAATVWQEQALSGVVTVAICVAYTLVGPLLIMLNKLLLSKAGFPYPVLLTTFHQSTSALFAFVLVRGFGVVPLQHSMTWSWWARNSD